MKIWVVSDGPREGRARLSTVGREGAAHIDRVYRKVEIERRAWRPCLRASIEVERSEKHLPTSISGWTPDYFAGAIGTRTSVRIHRSTMSAPAAVFSNSNVS
jgi:hypothetical protein